MVTDNCSIAVSVLCLAILWFNRKGLKDVAVFLFGNIPIAQCKDFFKLIKNQDVKALDTTLI